MMHSLIIVLFCLALAWNRAPGGASGVGKVEDLLGAHVPPYLDALGL
jgi:hypothetical protein